MTLQTINPAKRRGRRELDETSPEAVHPLSPAPIKPISSGGAQVSGKRAALMRRAADVLRGNAREYAHLMAVEMGKPIRDGIAEIPEMRGRVRLLRGKRRAIPGA